MCRASPQLELQYPASSDVNLPVIACSIVPPANCSLHSLAALIPRRTSDQALCCVQPKAVQHSLGDQEQLSSGSTEMTVNIELPRTADQCLHCGQKDARHGVIA